MTKRQARKLAYRIAYRFVQQAVSVGGNEAERDGIQNDADQEKVELELDRIAQRLFELGQDKGE